MRIPLEVLAERYQEHVYAAAFSICRNPQDAEDVTQETFLAYHTKKQQYESEQHIRAWMIRVAINKAKNLTTSFWRRHKVSLEDYMETLEFEAPEDKTLFETVLGLPEKYRIVIHLFYYEGYKIDEMTGLLGCSAGTVKSRLARARKLLKETLKEDWEDDE